MKEVNRERLDTAIKHVRSAQREVYEAIVARKKEYGAEYGSIVVNTAEAQSWLRFAPEDCGHIAGIKEHLGVSNIYLGLIMVATLYGVEMPKDALFESQELYAPPSWVREFTDDVQSLMKQHWKRLKLDVADGTI